MRREKTDNTMASQQRSAAELKFMLKHVNQAMHKKQAELKELAEAAEELRVQIQRANNQDNIIQAELAKQSAAALQVQKQRLMEERKQILTPKK